MEKSTRLKGGMVENLPDCLSRAAKPNEGVTVPFSIISESILLFLKTR